MPAAVLASGMAGGALASGAVLRFASARGRGAPIVAAGTFTGAVKGLRAAGRWSCIIEKASGVIIIGVGLYLLWIA